MSMKKFNSLLYKSLAVIGLLLTVTLFCGCEPTEVQEAVVMKPVFFPPAPEKPRIQFLKSFSSADDFVSSTKTSAFEDFLLGEPEQTEGVVKPYGLDIYDGKIYICDISKKLVEVIDVRNNKFYYMTRDRRLIHPINIYIDKDGTKYIADPGAMSIFVFDRNDKLKSILGRKLKIRPIDMVVRGDYIYMVDGAKHQVVVLDKKTGEEINRIGKKGKELGQFLFIGGVALDSEDNIYVTDKIKGQITKFNKDGIFQRTYGEVSDSISGFVRPKGITFDREDRIWVIDSGSEVAKIYTVDDQFLLYFGLPDATSSPGTLRLPVEIVINYDSKNIELFSQYAVEGAKIEFLVLIANQYGRHKVSVYGFGEFPEQKDDLSDGIENLASEQASE